MGTSKERKRKNRRKRIIIAYTARTIVALVLATMIFLMGCGCLYVREHFFQKETTETSEDKDKDKETSNAKDDTDADKTTDKDTDDKDSSKTKKDIKSTFSYPDASGLTIVLDAGHGGNDGGTVTSLDESVLEKDINLAVVKKMQSLLQACGAEVILTRESDVYVELSERSYISNQTNGDIFISIHCNSYEDDPTIRGLEFYYYKDGTTSQEYADALVQSVSEIDDINVWSVRAENYQVLRDSSIPAVLIELGYLTNEEDLENLTDKNYQTLLAETLVTAIVDLFTDTTADTTTDTTANTATDTSSSVTN